MRIYKYKVWISSLVKNLPKNSKRVTLMYEQIYNLTSMFFKSLKGNLMYEFLISKFNGKRGSKRQLSLEQIVAQNIYRFHFKTRDLKNYHKMIKELMSDKVPNLPNYENFMKATNKSTLNAIISSTEASLNQTGERWKITSFVFLLIPTRKPIKNLYKLSKKRLIHQFVINYY